MKRQLFELKRDFENNLNDAHICAQYLSKAVKAGEFSEGFLQLLSYSRFLPACIALDVEQLPKSTCPFLWVRGLIVWEEIWVSRALVIWAIEVAGHRWQLELREIYEAWVLNPNSELLDRVNKLSDGEIGIDKVLEKPLSFLPPLTSIRRYHENKKNSLNFLSNFEHYFSGLYDLERPTMTALCSSLIGWLLDNNPSIQACEYKSPIVTLEEVTSRIHQKIVLQLRNLSGRLVELKYSNGKTQTWILDEVDWGSILGFLKLESGFTPMTRSYLPELVDFKIIK